MNDNENTTNAPTIELLPCPFCGATPNVEQIGNDATRKVRSRKTGIRVKCPTFGCCTEKFVGIIRESFEWATNAVIENWNKRAALNEADALRAEVEGLRSALGMGNDDFLEDGQPAAVHAFAKAMKGKLYQKSLEGYSGWDEPSAKEFIEASLFKHVERHRENGGQLVDIANLAMMLWNFEMKAAAIKPKEDK